MHIVGMQCKSSPSTCVQFGETEGNEKQSPQVKPALPGKAMNDEHWAPRELY